MEELCQALHFPSRTRPDLGLCLLERKMKDWAIAQGADASGLFYGVARGIYGCTEEEC
jgi:hypothetical protein